MPFTIPKTQLAVIINDELKNEIKEVPVILPGDDEILVKGKSYSTSAKPAALPITKDNIGSVVGSQVAGIVVQVGKNVTDFKPGDHVCSFAHGSYLPFPYPGAFSEYYVSRPHASYKFGYELEETGFEVTKLVGSDVVSTWDRAAGFGMSLGTIACSFYYCFGFRKGNDYSKDTIIIWSAGGNVGFVGAQLAKKWLGFKTVITTSSKAKFQDLLDAGIDDVFDYHDADVVEKIRSKYGDEITYGLDCFSSPQSFSSLYNVTSRTKPVILDNLLMKGEKDLIDIVPKTNPVTFRTCSNFLSFGDDIVLFGRKIAVPPGMVEASAAFRRDVEPFIQSKTLKALAVDILPHGLYGLCDPKGLMGDTAMKLVAREWETKPY